MVAERIGRWGFRLEPFARSSFDEAKDMFREQVEGLLEGGVDLFYLETFSGLRPSKQAVRAVREISTCRSLPDEDPDGRQDHFWQRRPRISLRSSMN